MPHERMSQYTDEGRFRENQGHDGAGRMREVYDRAQEVVGEHPAYSALACFGIGVGVGAALASLLCQAKPAQKEKAWYEDYLPDEKFRQDVTDQLRDAVNRMLPDAVARYLSKHR